MLPGTDPGAGLGMTGLRIGGLVPFTTVDMPGRAAAVVFCQGCPWRCRYCHNAHLRDLRADLPPAWDRFLRWLEPRQGFLDAIVFSGGEPTLQPDLPAAMGDVKAMGFQVGLHTGGFHSGALRQVLPLLDWIGLDIKAPRQAYDRITGVDQSGQAAWASLEQVLGSGVPYEIRTTYHPDLLTEPELRALAAELASAGARHWVLQPFRSIGCADASLAVSAPGPPNVALLDRLEALFLAFGCQPSSAPMASGARSFRLSALA